MSRPRTGLVLALVTLALATGCGSEPRRAGVLGRELDKICHAVDLSGAAHEEDANRMAMVAMWLDQNIKSQEGLDFLRTFSRLGEDKAARYQALDEAARANGVTDCPLLAFWK